MKIEDFLTSFMPSNDAKAGCEEKARFSTLESEILSIPMSRNEAEVVNILVRVSVIPHHHKFLRLS